ncbi:flagellar biosynthesis protein FliA [Arthrobacter alpinus]|uniref:Flagellar biosynthesis protein FliA n=1 Tax=Arthrobacter alpinus TaxID=656366 RepID=A0A0M3UGN8_9MICC|nr:flagellar biosynthesis protein FliA [Arthrobacter alpinus]
MNREERDYLVVQNLPLVGYLVSEICMRASHLSRPDLAQVGAVALIQCAESFDASLGVPFGAYARRRIKGAFADELRREDWATRGARSRMSELALMQETLSGALGRVPSTDELAGALGVERAAVEASQLDAARSVTPLTDVITDLVAATSQTPEELVLQNEHEAFLGEAVAALPQRMQYIVEQIYYRDRTVKELAEELGSSHSAVSQQRAEAMRLLRDGIERHYLATADARSQPHARIAASRREDYLADLGSRTLGGATRLLGQAAFGGTAKSVLALG